MRSSQTNIAGDSARRLMQARLRLLVVSAFLLLGYFIISLRLADLTLFHKEVAATAAAPEAGDIRVLAKPLRGGIFDRNGELMATSLKMASVYADTTLVRDPQALARELAEILPDQGEEILLKKLSSGKKFVWIERNITPKQQYAINTLGQPGLAFQEEDRRIYPHGRLTAHILGYTDVDGRGIAGVEKSFQGVLAAGEEDLRLTIDLRIQHILHRELSRAVTKFSAKAGIGMVMDVNTGEIIAMVSLPDFDPLHPAEAVDDAKFNRVSLGVFEMGSTFKLFSTAAALDAGAVSFGTQFNAAEPIRYGGHTITDYHSKNRMLTVPEIFIYSSNIGTARMALALGTEGMRDFYQKLGFFEPAEIELPERGAPLYPRPWRDISTLTASYGHGISVSPVHLMRAAAAMVNGGILVRPTLLATEKRGGILKPVGQRIVRPETSRMIRQLLELVVADGTGSKAYVEGYQVGGKTGTAEKVVAGRYNKKAVISSFLGIFPATQPRYAVVAILDEPQATKESYGYATGGWTAAPVVARVIEHMGPLYHIPPDFDATHDIVQDMAAYLKESKKEKGVAALGTHR